MTSEEGELVCLLLVLSCFSEVDILPYLLLFFQNAYLKTHTDNFVYRPLTIKRRMRNYIINMYMSVMKFDCGYKIYTAIGLAVLWNCLYEKYINSGFQM